MNHCMASWSASSPRQERWDTPSSPVPIQQTPTVSLYHYPEKTNGYWLPKVKTQPGLALLAVSFYKEIPVEHTRYSYLLIYCLENTLFQLFFFFLNYCQLS